MATIQQATPSSGQIYVETLVDSVVIITNGYTVGSLMWQDQLLEANHRISILDRQSKQPVWSWSDISGADDETNNFNGETDYANILSGVKTAFNDPGGGGGGGGTSNVDVVSSVLPDGAATETTLQNVATYTNTLLTTISDIADPDSASGNAFMVAGYDSYNGKTYAIPVTDGESPTENKEPLVKVGGRFFDAVNGDKSVPLRFIGPSESQQELAIGASAITQQRIVNLGTAPQAIAGAFFLFGYNIINPNNYNVYVKVYDEVNANIVVGVTPVKETILIPPTGAAVIPSQLRTQMEFSNEMNFACTIGYEDSDNNPVSTPIYVQLYCR